MIRQIALGLSAVVLVAWFVASPASSAEKQKVAVAQVGPTTQGSAKGTVTFTDVGDGKVKVVADIEGLKPNSKHGFHIHEGSEVGPDGMKAGGHFNPGKHQHGGPMAGEHHAGDLGNLEADASGKAHLEITLDDVTIGGAESNIVGRTVIVHAGQDDLKTQPTGNSGGRIGGGVIKAE
jgi:superoxide dismutase, Cu-Zn family